MSLRVLACDLIASPPIPCGAGPMLFNPDAPKGRRVRLSSVEKMQGDRREFKSKNSKS